MQKGFSKPGSCLCERSEARLQIWQFSRCQHCHDVVITSSYRNAKFRYLPCDGVKCVGQSYAFLNVGTPSYFDDALSILTLGEWSRSTTVTSENCMNTTNNKTTTTTTPPTPTPINIGPTLATPSLSKQQAGPSRLLVWLMCYEGSESWSNSRPTEQDNSGTRRG